MSIAAARASEFDARLSPAESRRLVAALSKPFAPNAALRRAMARGSKLGQNGRHSREGGNPIY